MKSLKDRGEKILQSIQNNWKRYLLSSLVTFLTGVAIVLLQHIDGITAESLKDGSLAGLVFVAVRAGVKAVLELFVQSTGDKL